MEISRQRRWQIKKRAEGFCMICGKPRVNASYCETHRKEINKINLKNQKKARKNETPEKREKRLEYHKNYKRKS